MTPEQRERWRNYAKQFTLKRWTLKTNLYDIMADFGAMVAKVTRDSYTGECGSLLDGEIRMDSDDELLAALEERIR